MEFDSVEFEELRNNTVSAISGISEADTELLKNACGEPEPVQPAETPEPTQPSPTQPSQ
jgi:hypothetical protein